MANYYLLPTITIPSALNIVSATKEVQMVITVAIANTTTQANTYVVGMCVKLNIPVQFGMIQANGRVGTIIEIVGNDMRLDINSTLFDSFVIPSSSFGPATICPFGSINLQYNNFTNKVPFQSFKNAGN